MLMPKVPNQIDAYYKKLKEQPYTFLKKPYYIFLIPFFVFIFLKKRWKTETDVIYLTETNLAGHKLLNSFRDHNYQFRLFFNQQDVIQSLIKRMNEETGLQNYIAETAKRFNRGDYLAALVSMNQIASYLFISEKTAELSQVKCNEKLEKGCFAIYDVYTFKDYRNRGLYEVLLSEVSRLMVKKTFNKFWLWVMKHNQISVAVHQKLEINKGKRVYKSCYRYGFRFISKKNVNFLLSDLLE